MALHFQTLKTRALTALAFVIVMLGGLLWTNWSFILLFTIIHFGCWYEFILLMKKIYGEKYLIKCFWGLAYITLPLLLMLDLGVDDKLQYSAIIPCGILFSIWINDTMAYLVGSVIGKTPFSKISPKKTWEGTAGGAILCVTGVAVLSKYITAAAVIDVKHWVAIAAICAITGTVGDLLESKLKRSANVKDSGSIMPGHGGFLDRFDSLLIATPFVWIYVELFIRHH
ncbi:MAG: phosphatidate cytidylyltransferase [Sphingobacteriales bacterium]|nr:phosphatidate cytidylyltransferase [Sphingobacteriales bacterium]